MFKFQEFDRVDHIAIAVVDLKESIRYYSDQLGFELDCVRDTFGKFSGMRSAVLFSGDFSVVLLQSLDEESQIQKYLDKYGAGVQHVAFRVSEIENVESLLQERGVEFSTSIIEGPDFVKYLLSETLRLE